VKQIRYKKAIIFVLIILFSVPLAFLLEAQQTTATSACVKCHTNENILKILYKPPKIDVSEGEG